VLCKVLDRIIEEDHCTKTKVAKALSLMRRGMT
jgi:hypothetical protein